jgi:hypothetical protein
MLTRSTPSRAPFQLPIYDTIASMKVTDVFTPGSLPTFTYYDRSELNLEFKLLEAIETRGYLCSVSGPSKSGKTVLCESVIGKSKILLVTGGGVKTEEQFWQKIRTKLNLPTFSTKSKTSGSKIGFKASGEGELQVPLIAKGKAGAEGSTSLSREKENSSTYEGQNGISLLEYIHREGYTLVIDDFHYIVRDVQKSLAEQFKEAARSGCSIVIVSVTHRSDDAIRANPDLRGRVVSVDIPYWSNDELRHIATRGFVLLNLDVSLSLIERLITESLMSPQLTQALCLQFCRDMKIEQDMEELTTFDLRPDQISLLLRNTTSIANCKFAFDTILAGPRTRGEERKLYDLKDGRSGDVYYVILKALASGKPLLTVSYDDLKGRISKLTTGDSPRGVSVIGALDQMNEAVNKKLHEDRVIEWDENNVNFPDPYFLYYLRWTEW